MDVLKQKLLAAAALRTEVVEIDEGVSVTVREIGTTEFTEYGRLVNGDPKAGKPGDPRKATAYIIASCVVDESGVALLTMEESRTLADSARVSMKIVNAVMRLSGFAEKETVAS